MDEILHVVRSLPGFWSLLAVFFAAAIEYLVPPAPADMIIVGSSLLIVAGVWPFGAVAAAGVLGGTAGAYLQYLLGRALAHPSGVRGTGWVERFAGPGSLDRFIRIYRKHGYWVLALNRFFPGVRAITFFAAGAAQIPLGPAMALAFVSNVAWTSALLGLGVALGDNWSRIEELLGVYRYAAAAVLLTAVALFFIVRAIRRRRRVLGSSREGDE